MKRRIPITSRFLISAFVILNLCSIPKTYSNCTSSATVTGSTTVCAGINTGTIRLSSSVNSVARWEFASTVSGPWYTIANTADTFVYTNLISTSYFRAIVIQGTCDPGASQIALITVNPASVGGTVTGGTTVCSGTNSGILNLTGFIGNILRWEYSINGTTWSKISNTTNFYSFSNLTATTYFRALVKSGLCDSAYSGQATVTINPLPIVNFTYTGTCEMNKTFFTNTCTIGSGGSIASYNWDFGDGGSSVAANPTYIFSSYGINTVQLTVTSNKNCISSSTPKNITINPLPIVDFNQTDICYKNQMHFYNNSFIPSGTFSSKWDFGDAVGKSVAINPSYLYSSAGTYNAKLVATSDKLCKDSLTLAVKVFPKADVNFSANNVCKGTDVIFKNNSSIQGSSLTYLWKFGDGITSTNINPSHLYTTSGAYNVSLITTSPDLCMDTSTLKLYVNPQPIARFNIQNTCFGKPLQLKDTSYISNGTINWLWDFSDGTTSTLQNPSHIYASAGAYSVILKVTSDSGCFNTLTKPLTIYARALPNFTFSNVCDKDTVLFHNNSISPLGTLTYKWDFDDGVTSPNKEPKHLYSATGKYNVMLIAKTTQGCSDTVKNIIEIFPKPFSNFTVTSTCLGIQSAFTDQSTISSGTIQKYDWDFGDTSSSLLKNPMKLYRYTGSFLVKLVTTSDKGCINSIIKPASVLDFPIVKFICNNNCFTDAVQFTNQSTIKSGTLSYLWDFGDGTSTEIIKNPTHSYSKSGFYTVKLQATSNNNCKSEFSQNVELFKLPAVSAGTDLRISKGYSTKLNATGARYYEWSPITNLSDPNISNPEASPQQTTTYFLKGTNEYGCVGYDTITVFVDDNFQLDPNTVITPDNNGKNDTWVIQNIELYPNTKVYVFDRLGTEVFSATNYKNDWNCTNKDNEILPDGTYYYVIQFNGSTRIYKGALTIIRKY